MIKPESGEYAKVSGKNQDAKNISPLKLARLPLEEEMETLLKELGQKYISKLETAAEYRRSAANSGNTSKRGIFYRKCAAKLEEEARQIKTQVEKLVLSSFTWTI